MTDDELGDGEDIGRSASSPQGIEMHTDLIEIRTPEVLVLRIPDKTSISTSLYLVQPGHLTSVFSISRSRRNQLGFRNSNVGKNAPQSLERTAADFKSRRFLMAEKPSHEYESRYWLTQLIPVLHAMMSVYLQLHCFNYCCLLVPVSVVPGTSLTPSTWYYIRDAFTVPSLSTSYPTHL